MKMSLSNSLSGLLLGLLLLFSPLPAAHAADFDVVGAYGQQQSFVATHDHYAYVAGGCNLRVLDIADPAHPQPIGYLRLENDVTHMLLKWPALYVSQREQAGIWVIDLSDPKHPCKKGATLPSDHDIFSYDINIFGEFLVTAGNHKNQISVDVYHLHDPLLPQSVLDQTYRGNPQGFDFFISGAQLLVSHIRSDGKASQLVISDDNQSPPREIGRFSLPDTEPDTAELMYDRQTSQLSYVYGETSFQLGHFNSGQTFHEKDSIREIETEASTPAKITLSWPQLNVTGFNQVKVADRIAYAAKDASLSVINCRQPENPTLITSITLAAPIRAYSIEDRAIYAATANGRLEIFDTGKPASPHQVGSLEITTATTSMASSENALYLLSPEQGLQIYTLPSFDKPILSGSFRPQQQAYDLVTSGTLIYLLGNESLTIIDAHDPRQPQQVGRLTLRWGEENNGKYLSDQAPQLKRVGSYLYAFHWSPDQSPGWPNACLIINATDPIHPVVGNQFTTDDPLEIQPPPLAAKPLPTPKTPYVGYTLALPYEQKTNHWGSCYYSFYDLTYPLAPRLPQKVIAMNPGQPVIGREALYLPTGEGLLVLRRRE